MEILGTGNFLDTKFTSITLASKNLGFYKGKKNIIDGTVNFMMNVLLFMQFTEIETIITEGENSRGIRKVKINKEKNLNESDVKVEIID
jgi:FMN-dependent NADH-azoreductase